MNVEKLEQQMAENQSILSRVTGPLSRRHLLAGGGIGALALVVAACGDDEDDPAASGDPTTSTTGDDAGADLAVAMTAASLEVLAVSTYGSALEAATSGALGEVPPAVAEYVTTAQEHHQAHLDAWNEVLTGAGEDEVTEPPADLAATVDEMFAEVTDVVGAAKLARTLEQIAADTYLAVIPTLQDDAATELAASIQTIDMQHIAVLNFVLGEYPVPDTFAGTENAYTG